MVASKIISEHKHSARAAGLRYASDRDSGIRRKFVRGNAVYFTERGRRVRDPYALARIRALAIPPAWTDVWIARHKDAHLQATGRDAKGRKQYRYHPRWNEVRDTSKYTGLIEFAQALPRVRRRVQRDLRRRGLPREKVLATVIRLLETSLIRVGNEEYARQNHSFGLTTMQDRHVDVRGRKIRFHFRGKSGIVRDLDVNSSRLARIVKRCQDLPGQQLFQYVDFDGRVRSIGSADVNEYLRQISGREISAKDFRTWAGTWLAAQALREFKEIDSRAAAKRNVLKAIERVAARLGNTRAVCRKCYIHPEVIEAYLDRALLKHLRRRAERELQTKLSGLSAEEAAVLALLQERMKHQLAASNGRGPATHSAKNGRKPHATARQ